VLGYRVADLVGLRHELKLRADLDRRAAVGPRLERTPAAVRCALAHDRQSQHPRVTHGPTGVLPSRVGAGAHLGWEWAARPARLPTSEVAMRRPSRGKVGAPTTDPSTGTYLCRGWQGLLRWKVMHQHGHQGTKQPVELLTLRDRTASINLLKAQ
jgi:hypothetical protein